MTTPSPDQRNDLESPYDKASFLSKLFFSWPTRILEVGQKPDILITDLPKYSVEDDVYPLTELFYKSWNVEKKKDKPSLLRTLLELTRIRNKWPGVILLAESGVRIYQAVLLGNFISYLINGNPSGGIYGNGYFLSSLIVICGVLITLLHHQAFFFSYRYGLQLRLTMTSVIYDKAIRLHLRSLTKLSVGHIVNLCSQDVESFQNCGTYLHFTYQPIIESAFVIYVGVLEIGPSFLAGFAFILLLLPFQSFFSRQLSHSRKSTAAYTDERLKLINQALTGARLMKINGWEWTFANLIERVRKLEILMLLRTSRLRGINEAIFFCAPALVSCFTFVTYSQTGGTLSVQTVLTVLTLFNITQFSMTKFFPFAVQFCTEAYVSVIRIQRLLLLDDIDQDIPQIKEYEEVGSYGLKGNKDMSFRSLSSSASIRKELSFRVGSPLLGDEKSSSNPSLSPTTSVTKRRPAFERSLSTGVFDSRGKEVYIRLKHVYASWMDDAELPLSVLQNGQNNQTMKPFEFSATGDDENTLVNRTGSSQVYSKLDDSKKDSYSPECKEGDVLSLSQTHTQSSNSPLTLVDIDLTITRGEFLLVVGPVGSSKSSLLMAIMGELKTLAGEMRVGGDKGKEMYTPSIAYCAQEPWILSTTVRGNILFGNDFDEMRYREVLAACSLTHDLEILPHGDHTIIGDRGVNLSGGQKARIGLARALYSDADIFLLDDPISAVDSRVGNELFNAAISTYLAKKTRILVTHQIQFLNASSIHRIVVMDQGRVASCGTYGELLKNGSLDWIRTIYNKELDSANDVIEEGDENAEDKSVANDDEEGDSNSNRKRSKSSINSESAVDADSIDVTVEALANKAEVEGAANAVEQGITVIEDRQLGTVKISTYSGYVDAIGGLIPLLIITFLLLAGQGLAVSANIWLAKWSRLPYDQQQIQKNMDIFLYLVAGTVAGAFLRAIIIFDFFVRGAEAIQNKMLRSVIRAPILFFDSNPIGRVMNRFSRDIGVLDDLLPSTLFDYCQCLLMCLAAIVVVGIGSPYILLTIVPLSVYFYRLRQHYVRSSREIKRLEAMSRSPIFSHLNETLEGLVTIRGYKKAGDFTHMFRENVNNNTRAFFCFIATSRWLGFRLDIIVALLLVATTFITTGLKESNSGIDSTVLAVGLMYVIQLCGMFQWTVRQSAEVENLMVSVERALAFSKLPSEPALHGPTDMIKYPEWPSKGQIELDHLTCTYRSDLPPVIRDVSVTMTAGQRIGIVGRTGSGKSTLIGALLRLVDITGGQIRIDGLDILQVGLHDLRPKISVIPQTPFLFSETVRKNMDAFSLHSDIEIWAALDSVGLRSVIEKLAASTGREGLDGLVEENGSNFSVGERQLVCLARAILQRNSILIMDEATANVDMETDARVQETIRRQFTQSTVIMIAHRLQTIIDCDKVLVLRNGIVVEYDHPHMLLQKYNNGKYASPQRQVELHDIDAMTNKNVDNDDATESYMKSFAHMVDETGESMSTFLRSQAELAFK